MPDGPPPSLDALLPPAMARRAEDVGVAKAGLDATTTLTLGVLAGAFIALGGVAATVAQTGAGQMPWGVVRLLAGTAFSLGLILVIVGGAELFTGNTLLVMAWASGRVRSARLLRNWALVFAGNFVGAAATAFLVAVAGTHRSGGGAFGATALAIARAKVELEPVPAVTLGLLCNALVCLAVWLTLSARTTADRILAIVPPIAAFVAAGFEHSIANMYFVPYALFVAALDPGFVAGRVDAAAGAALGWGPFLVRNLVPVTVGNVAGGAGLVGAVYWFVYLRPGAVAAGAPAARPEPRPGARRDARPVEERRERRDGE
jgi:formate/nitrite transporter